MKFLINVLPNNSFDNHNVTNFISNIKEQQFQNVKLIFKKTDSLNDELINKINNLFDDSQIVNDYDEINLDSNEDNYWINLNVNDCLLPNALLQWEAMIKRHPNSTFELSYLNDELSLNQQIDQRLEAIEALTPIKIDTVKRLLDLDISFNQTTLQDKLKILLGLQEYVVKDDLKRYEVFEDNLLGKNVLYHCSNDTLKEHDPSSLVLVIKQLAESNEIIRLNMPTLILGPLSLFNRIQWINDFDYGKNYIGDPTVLAGYQKDYASHLAWVKKQINSSDIEKDLKINLLSQIDSDASSVSKSSHFFDSINKFKNKVINK